MARLIPAPVMYILLSLADADRHGYAIMQHVRDGTNGEIVLGPGALYTSLQRAMAAGYITDTSTRPATAEERGRRTYRLTALGRRAAETELARLQNVLKIARGANLKPAREGQR